MERNIFVQSFFIGILIGISLIRCFTNIGTPSVEKWDEQTNIAVIQNSLPLKTPPFLYLHNEPFLEKPPLWYLINVVIGSMAGITPQSMRIVSAVSGVCFIIFSAYLAFSWWGAIAGYTTWIILVTTNHLFITNPANNFSTHTVKSADVDSIYILFLLCAFGFGARRHTLWLTGIFSGLAILTKGPFGVVPLIIISFYTFFKEKPYIRDIHYAWIITFLVTFPWHMYMTQLLGTTFINSYVVYHLVERFVLPIEGHSKQLWYYISLIIRPEIFPGCILFPITIAWMMNQKKFFSDKYYLYCFFMALLCLVVPTITQTKLAWYILPFYPFAALLIGAGIQNMWNSLGKNLLP
jgi:4-amino-4-deoxy-L-arabinose transferase-like glycosyltransferase